jgi:hypothetical protein
MAKRSQLFMLPISETKPPSPLVVSLLILLPLYAPFAWIVTRPGAWDEKRWLWIKSWPALPGFVVQSLDIFEGRPVWVNYASMGLLALLILVVFYRLGRISKSWLVLSFLLAAGYSSYNSWLAFQAY